MTKEQKQKLIELRCKAWGITEDEYYCNQCSDFSLEDMARAYRRGKNKGARDKAIQNVGFYQKQMQDIYDKKNKQIAELEETIKRLQKQILEFTRELHTSNKENVELKEQISIKDILIKELQEQKVYWKESSFDWRHKFFKLDKIKRLIKKDKQLNKAKELLKQWIELYKPKLEGYPITPIQEQTEQFLNEVEEC